MCSLPAWDRPRWPCRAARGYLGRPELTAERFIPNPFTDFGLRAPSGHLDFRLATNADPIQNRVPRRGESKIQNGDRLYKTGDLARYRPDGAIEFLGRIDYQVKIRGFRIELGEIEVVLAQHPAIKEVVVVAREDTPGNKRLVAYLAPAVRVETADLSVEALRNFLKETLPSYMIPSAFVILETLPLMTNGKVNRMALPAPEMIRPKLEVAYVPPRNPTEELLARIWAQVLGIDKVGVYDNFFDLGGASIQSLQVITKANEVGLRLTPELLFEHQTIAELAAVAAPEGGGLASALGWSDQSDMPAPGKGASVSH